MNPNDRMFYHLPADLSNVMNSLPKFNFCRQEEVTSSVNLEAIQNQVNMIVHNQLMQAIIEEKIKNEILTNALIINNRLLEAHRSGQISEVAVQPSQAVQPVRVQTTVKEQLTCSRSQKEESSEEDEDDNDKSFVEESSERDYRRGTKKALLRRLKNQTKNIPKNFGKAIISFIEKRERLTKSVLSKFPHLDYAQFILDMRIRRKKINSIADLRGLWIEEENRFAAPTRILSLIFLKKYSLTYIFHSRVTNFQGHIKYRYRLMEAIKNPKGFTSIKAP